MCRMAQFPPSTAESRANHGLENSGDSLYPYERYGRHVGTRTPDLYRVKVRLINTYNNFPERGRLFGRPERLRDSSRCLPSPISGGFRVYGLCYSGVKIREVLGEGTMVFFISMKSVWINLTLATAQIPSSDEVVEFVNGQQPEYAIKYLGKLFDQVFVLRDLFKDFTTTATQCAEWLERKGSEHDPLAAMFVPEGLENGSRDAAFDWSDISSEIQLDETLERWRSAQKDSQEFLGKLNQARAGADKYEQMLKGFADEQRRFLKDQPNDTQLSDEPKP
jgi:hypothetical protein